jgi:uncharacterized protein
MGENGWPSPDGVARARLILKGRLAAVARLPARRAPDGAVAEYRSDQSLRHVAQAIGIPACEIGGSSADGEPWPLELPPPDGSTVELDPASEPVDLGRRPSFLADAHLGRLSRVLRLLGFDSLWRRDADRDRTIETALGEARVVLTRDRGLLYERPLSRPSDGAGDGAAAPRRGMLILASDPYRKLIEVSSRFGLEGLWRPLSLCSSCGAEIRAASKAEVLPRLPAAVAERYEEFSLCPSCGKAYWKGDHARSIESLLARLRSDLGLG